MEEDIENLWNDYKSLIAWEWFREPVLNGRGNLVSNILAREAAQEFLERSLNEQTEVFKKSEYWKDLRIKASGSAKWGNLENVKRMDEHMHRINSLC